MLQTPMLCVCAWTAHLLSLQFGVFGHGEGILARIVVHVSGPTVRPQLTIVHDLPGYVVGFGPLPMIYGMRFGIAEPSIKWPGAFGVFCINRLLKPHVKTCNAVLTVAQ